MTDHPTDACDACADAFPPDRRAFLRDAALAVAAALLGVGAAPRAARAHPLAFAAPSAVRGATVRYPVPSQDGASIDREHEVILVRWEGALYAFNLSCPHQRTALRWVDGARRFQCPKHKSRYRPDGGFIEGRATRGMDRFALRREGGEVEVDLDALFRQDRDPSGWSSAVARA